MANETDIIILDLNNTLFQRNKLRMSEDSGEEVERLQELRAKQKAWNYKRGILVRKYNKILKDPKSSKVQQRIIKRDLDNMPRYNLKNIDNEISRLQKEDYIITAKWKGGDYQMMSSELINKPNPAQFILGLVKESKEGMNFGANDENRIKLLKVIEYNLRALEFGNFETPSKNEYPIFVEFVGDYIIIKI